MNNIIKDLVSRLILDQGEAVDISSWTDAKNLMLKCLSDKENISNLGIAFDILNRLAIRDLVLVVISKEYLSAVNNSLSSKQSSIFLTVIEKASSLFLRALAYLNCEYSFEYMELESYYTEELTYNELLRLKENYDEYCIHFFQNISAGIFGKAKCDDENSGSRYMDDNYEMIVSCSKSIAILCSYYRSQSVSEISQNIETVVDMFNMERHNELNYKSASVFVIIEKVVHVLFQDPLLLLSRYTFTNNSPNLHYIINACILFTIEGIPKNVSFLNLKLMSSKNYDFHSDKSEVTTSQNAATKINLFQFISDWMISSARYLSNTNDIEYFYRLVLQITAISSFDELQVLERKIIVQLITTTINFIERFSLLANHMTLPICDQDMLTKIIAASVELMMKLTSTELCNIMYRSYLMLTYIPLSSNVRIRLLCHWFNAFTLKKDKQSILNLQTLESAVNMMKSSSFQLNIKRNDNCIHQEVVIVLLKFLNNSLIDFANQMASLNSNSTKYPLSHCITLCDSSYHILKYSRLTLECFMEYICNSHLNRLSAFSLVFTNLLHNAMIFSSLYSTKQFDQLQQDTNYMSTSVTSAIVYILNNIPSNHIHFERMQSKLSNLHQHFVKEKQQLFDNVYQAYLKSILRSYQLVSYPLLTLELSLLVSNLLVPSNFTGDDITNISTLKELGIGGVFEIYCDDDFEKFLEGIPDICVKTTRQSSFPAHNISSSTAGMTIYEILFILFEKQLYRDDCYQQFINNVQSVCFENAHTSASKSVMTNGYYPQYAILKHLLQFYVVFIYQLVIIFNSRYGENSNNKQAVLMKSNLITFIKKVKSNLFQYHQTLKESKTICSESLCSISLALMRMDVLISSVEFSPSSVKSLGRRLSWLTFKSIDMANSSKFFIQNQFNVFENFELNDVSHKIDDLSKGDDFIQFWHSNRSVSINSNSLKFVEYIDSFIDLSTPQLLPIQDCALLESINSNDSNFISRISSQHSNALHAFSNPHCYITQSGSTDLLHLSSCYRIIRTPSDSIILQLKMRLINTFNGKISGVNVMINVTKDRKLSVHTQKLSSMLNKNQIVEFLYEIPMQQFQSLDIEVQLRYDDVFYNTNNDLSDCSTECKVTAVAKKNSLEDFEDANDDMNDSSNAESSNSCSVYFPAMNIKLLKCFLVNTRQVSSSLHSIYRSRFLYKHQLAVNCMPISTSSQSMYTRIMNLIPNYHGIYDREILQKGMININGETISKTTVAYVFETLWHDQICVMVTCVESNNVHTAIIEFQSGKKTTINELKSFDLIDFIHEITCGVVIPRF